MDNIKLSFLVGLLGWLHRGIPQGGLHSEIGREGVNGLPPPIRLVARQGSLIQILGLLLPMFGVVVPIPCGLGVVMILSLFKGVEWVVRFNKFRFFLFGEDRQVVFVFGFRVQAVQLCFGVCH